jgi:hypothetical protein
VIAADGAHRAVVEIDQGSGDVVSIVNMYEDIPFQVYTLCCPSFLGRIR